VIATIPVGTNPNGVGVNPLTNRIFVTNQDDNTISVINGVTNTVIATVPVGAHPFTVGVNPSEVWNLGHYLPYNGGRSVG
jgi:YVTN family beta-propeller protein